MPARKVLPWRPRSEQPAPIGDPALLWTMRRDRWQIECVLQDRGRQGWTLHGLLNGLTFFHSPFKSWEDAIENAENRYAALVDGGWTPVPLSREDQYRPA